MDSVTSEAVQRWTRVALYALWGALANYGVTVGDAYKTMALTAAGFVMTVVWTKYGTTLSALLAEVKKTTGVELVEVHVDPTVIKPAVLNDNTPNQVVVKAAA